MRGVITLAVSCTDQIDTPIERERESWRDVEQLLTLAAGMQLDDDGQTDDYCLVDFISISISGYPFKQSIFGYADIG